MLRLRAIRRPLLVSFVVCTVGAFALLAVTQALAARRPWGARNRPANRAPAQTTPTPLPTTPPANSPTPALRRPEPDPPSPISVPDELLRAVHEEPDQAAVEHIIEIRRLMRRDPLFRQEDEGKADGLALEERYEASEAAFKRALERVGSGEGAISVSKTPGRDGQATYRMTIQSEQTDRCEATPAATTSASALRSAARVLDARAGDCEDRSAFDRADELRELASQLRKEARRTEAKIDD